MSRGAKWAVIRTNRPKMPWELEGNDLLDAHLFGRYMHMHGSIEALHMWGITREFAQIIADVEAAEADPAKQEAQLLHHFRAYMEQLAVHESELLIRWIRFWKSARIIGGGMERRRVAREENAKTPPTTLRIVR